MIDVMVGVMFDVVCFDAGVGRCGQAREETVTKRTEEPAPAELLEVARLKVWYKTLSACVVKGTPSQPPPPNRLPMPRATWGGV